FLLCMFTQGHLQKILRTQKPMKRFLVPFLLCSRLSHWCHYSNTFFLFLKLMTMEK
ncbi:hypothetical protein S83_035338, partial [Arachis hypogaea]